MGEKYDLSKFMVDPNRFTPDSRHSLVSEEFMTEMVATNLPAQFNAARASDECDDLLDDVYPDYPPLSVHGREQ